MLIKTYVLQKFEHTNFAIKNFIYNIGTMFLVIRMIETQSNTIYRGTKTVFSKLGIFGKPHQKSFTQNETTTKPGQIIHSDVCRKI